MCGIAGFIDFNKATSEQDLVNMTDSLEHRGPDDKGYKVWKTDKTVIGFGHRRLSIIDLSPLGHQPMFSRDGRWAIVFNGEIYNYKEIQTELKGLGYQFNPITFRNLLNRLLVLLHIHGVIMPFHAIFHE